MAPFNYRDPSTYGGMVPWQPEEPPMWEPSLEELQQMMAGAYQAPPPPGFLDRLAMGLQGVQGPSYGPGAALAGFAQGFSGARMGAMGRREQELARKNQANLAATQAHIQQRMRPRPETQAQRNARIEQESAARARGTASAQPPATTGKPEATRVPVPAKLRPYVDPATKDLTTGELSSLMQTYFPNTNERLVQVMGPGGGPVWVPESEARGKPATQAARAVTGAERQALAYYNRAKDAIDTVDALEQQIAASGLVGQAQLKYAPNFLKAPDQQRYTQAQSAFTEARLRKESGAAIPMHEYESDARIYFAQPGDDAATIEQKRLKRQTVLDGLAYSSGKAYEEYYGEPMTKTTPRGGKQPAAPAGDRVRVIGPEGQRGTVPRTSKLPSGWRLE